MVIDDICDKDDDFNLTMLPKRGPGLPDILQTCDLVIGQISRLIILKVCKKVQKSFGLNWVSGWKSPTNENQNMKSALISWYLLIEEP